MGQPALYHNNFTNNYPYHIGNGQYSQSSATAD